MQIQPIQMPISMTQGMIQPIQPLEAQSIANSTEVSAANFKDLLKNALTDLNASQVGANESIKNLATGGEENLHDVMISMEKASLTLQYAIQIRNKVLESYQSVIQMQI
ncbi:MAG TPA: flagellar hook-basal body complex protein FliE [bacterium]|nr:flagellar hook-basal body complex protein FliE [bacterium]